MAPLQDPRIRQTWNNISHNAETATETAAAGIWTFTQTYINPCLSSVSESVDQCTSHCFPDRDERARRLRERGRTRGRAEYSFDFYDDWDDEEEGRGSGGLLGWGNDELDRLLAGSGSRSQVAVDEQPSGRRRGMSYGTRRGSRRKNTIDGLADPTIIPSTNTLGFLQRLPFKIGGTLRYKPSAADLQEHPGVHRAEGDEEEGEPLIDEDHDGEAQGHDDDFDMSRTRPRSSTTGSGDTSDSFRSRGDLFPSDGEDDAVPLSDEFATVLERRNSGLDDRGSGKTRSSKGKHRPSASRTMSRTVSRTTQSSGASRPSLAATAGRSSSASLGRVQATADSGEHEEEAAALTELQQEEERAKQDEDAEVERKRQAAARLAEERGLNVTKEATSEVKVEEPVVDDIPPPSSPPELPLQDPEEVPAADPPPSLTPDEAPAEDFVPARLPHF